MSAWKDAIEKLYIVLAFVLVGLSAYYSYITWGVVSAIVAPILVAIVMAVIGYFLFEYEP
jgi:hypothetical protein